MTSLIIIIIVSPAACPGDDVIDIHLLINAVGLVNEKGSAVWRRLEVVWSTATARDSDLVRACWRHCYVYLCLYR